MLTKKRVQRPRSLMAEKQLKFILPFSSQIAIITTSHISNARLVELVDTLGLEPSARAWGFESLTGHHRTVIAYVGYKKPGLAPWLFFCLQVLIRLVVTEVTHGLKKKTDLEWLRH